MARLDPATKWVRARSPLIWRCWDEGEYVVYHSGSGDTHLVNEVTAEVLRQLEDGPRATAELAVLVAEALGYQVAEESVREIALLLDHLDGLGLVEPAT